METVLQIRVFPCSSCTSILILVCSYDYRRKNGSCANLKQRRVRRVPFLFGTRVPRVEHREADFAVVVEIRIEANRVVACRAEVHLRRLLRVIWWEEYVELEATA